MDDDAAVTGLYRSMPLQDLRRLRAALVMDANNARRRDEPDSAVFAWGRIALIDEELTRRTET